MGVSVIGEWVVKTSQVECGRLTRRTFVRIKGVAKKYISTASRRKTRSETSVITLGSMLKTHDEIEQTQTHITAIKIIIYSTQSFLRCENRKRRGFCLIFFLNSTKVK